jgi:Bacteriophage tail sheath protein
MIERASMRVAGFVGLTPGGPAGRPIRVTSWTHFARLFGDPSEPDNGPFMAGAYLAHAVRGFFENGGRRCWVVRVPVAADSEEAESKLIKIEETGGSVPEELRAPEQGLGGLSAIDEITMVSMPDALSVESTAKGLVASAERTGDRIAILDPPASLGPAEVVEWRSALGLDSSNATLYWPWIEVSDPLGGGPLLAPPSGHVAGVWARNDLRRGVHNAPANLPVFGVTGAASDVTDEDESGLTKAGVNAIRSFRGRGIRVWGSRTLSSDPEWRNVGVRRFALFIERSLDQGLDWVVFEPNDEHLRTRIRNSISSFLGSLWEDGALAGASPEEAYFVKCDEETDTEVSDPGVTLIEIGVAPSEPGRFLTLRLAKSTAGPPAA